MSKNDVCFIVILSLGLLSSSAYMSFMYIMYYIFKAGVYHHVDKLVLIKHLRVVHISK